MLIIATVPSKLVSQVYGKEISIKNRHRALALCHEGVRAKLFYVFLQLLYHIHARNITSFMLVCQRRESFCFYFSFSSGTLI